MCKTDNWARMYLSYNYTKKWQLIATQHLSDKFTLVRRTLRRCNTSALKQFKMWQGALNKCNNSSFIYVYIQQPPANYYPFSCWAFSVAGCGWILELTICKRVLTTLEHVLQDCQDAVFLMLKVLYVWGLSSLLSITFLFWAVCSWCIDPVGIMKTN